MLNVSTLGAGLLLMFGSATAALGANIELGAVGDDAPNYLWCMKAEHKITLRQNFSVTFRGRSTLTQGEIGRILIANESIAYFEWQEFLQPDPDPSPTLYFPQTMAPLTGPQPKLRPRANMRPGLYYIEFIAMDSTGAFGGRPRGCLVEVVNELPAVEVTDLTSDPPQTGVSTVRMTIRNNMPSSAPSLVGVPWSISLSMRSGRNTFTETPVTAGMQTNVRPGSTFQVTAQVPVGVADVWSHDQLIGRADPFNFIGENEAERANNLKAIAFISAYPPPPVSPPPVHTCESGFTEVTTPGGALGCAQDSTTPARCVGVWNSIVGYFTGSCSTGTLEYNCSSSSDCVSGSICPTSGAAAGKCTPGHVP